MGDCFSQLFRLFPKQHAKRFPPLALRCRLGVGRPQRIALARARAARPPTLRPLPNGLDSSTRPTGLSLSILSTLSFLSLPTAPFG